MKIRKVTAAFFSPGGNVEKIAIAIGRTAAEMLEAEFEMFDFLPPGERDGVRNFDSDELLIIGLPVFAGRLPNKILPFVQSGFRAAEASPDSRNDDSNTANDDSNTANDDSNTANDDSNTANDDSNTALDNISAGKTEKPLCIPFVSFGNRSFDDGLSELVMEMRNSGFEIAGAAAVVGQHSFCETLAPGRPDEKDMEEIKSFSRNVCRKITSLINEDIGSSIIDEDIGNSIIDENIGNSIIDEDIGSSIIDEDIDSSISNETTERIGDTGSDKTTENSKLVVPGNTPPGPYYTPLREDGERAVFLKAKPVTDLGKCDRCMDCAERCPMGSISKEDPSEVPGICIKCQACIKVCHAEAKHFEDTDFLSHRDFLHLNHRDKKENLFVYSPTSTAK